MARGGHDWMRVSERRALRGLAKAYAGPFPIRAHRTAAEAFDWPDAPLPEEFEIPAGDKTTADTGGGCEGSAPEGTSGALATGVCVHPANADQRHKQGLLEPSGLPEDGSGCNVGEMGVTAGETAPEPPPVALTIGGLSAAFPKPERRAEMAVRTRSQQVFAEIATAGLELKVMCRCGGAQGGLVPQWFGRNCIERACPLKVPA